MIKFFQIWAMKFLKISRLYYVQLNNLTVNSALLKNVEPFFIKTDKLLVQAVFYFGSNVIQGMIISSKEIPPC